MGCGGDGRWCYSAGMTQEEEQLAIGRMVMGRKALREQVAALAGEVDRATKELQTVAGLLSNYRDRDTYSEPLNLSPGAVELLNVPKLTALVNDLLAVRKELSEVQAQLSQAGID